MKLSVLICSLPNRLKPFDVIENLEFQARGKPVEILYLGDNKSRTTGEKRQHLLELATGDYVCFVDDDDVVATNYVDEILKLARSGKDALCFNVELIQNETKRTPVDFSIDNTRRNERHCHYRTPNHLMPIKRNKALKAGFMPGNFGEDKDYAKRVAMYLTNQGKTDKTLYFYHANDKTTEARTKENIQNEN